MEINTAGFARDQACLDRMRNDKVVMEAIEKFLPSMHTLTGGILVINRLSQAEKRTADRYMAVMIFLLSHWTIPVQYGLRCERTAASVDITPLLLVKQPEWLRSYQTGKSAS